MPFQSTRAKLILSSDVRAELEKIGHSRTAAARRVERAQMLLAYADGETVSAIARRLHTNRPKVERCLNKALQFGAMAALGDLQRPGRPRDITAEARAWLVALACRKPTELGYAEELWTMRLLAEHCRKHAPAAGHPSLARLARGTVSKILKQHELRPHKVRYYLERRDPEFDRKMANVLMIYQLVEVLRKSGSGLDSGLFAFVSYDEKPGIQAIGRTAPDLPPAPGRHAAVGRDYEYQRHGTLTLMAGLDLLTGHVHSAVVDRHRSREFVAFLKQLDRAYPPETRIHLILDNHSAHISKETRAYLATTANRFDFTFTPTHGSWLNLVESYFSKVARTLLRGIRVDSKDELKRRIESYIDRINEEPRVYRWKYRTDQIVF